MNKLWQEQPTRENAIALMKKQAASQGLKAIYSVKIESESTSLAKNCWASITARGIAYADVQPERPTLDQLVHKHTVDNEKNMDEAAALVKPLFECVKRRAISPELYTTSESADVLARAVVGLCSQEEGAYQGAVYKLAMTSSVNPAELIHDIHQKGLDYALTIIVEVRQRLHNPSPSSEKPVKSKEEPA